MKATDTPIVVEVTLGAGLDEVWAAITQPDQMTGWFFEEIEAFEARVGFETRFDVLSGERCFIHVWAVTEARPMECIAYGWRYEGLKGDSHVSFKLAEVEGGTRLSLTHQVLEDFAVDVPEFTREACIGGWVYFLQERLPAYLAAL